MNVIETRDLILEKAKMSDTESLYKNYWSQKRTAEFMLWVPCKNLEEAEERMKKTIAFEEKHEYCYIVREKCSGEAIGMAGMIEIEPRIFEDCGIGMGPQFVGRGYGKQILGALVQRLFKDGATKIICSCHADNVASMKLQESCGFKFSHAQTKTREKDNLTYKAIYNVIEKEER